MNPLRFASHLVGVLTLGVLLAACDAADPNPPPPPPAAPSLPSAAAFDFDRSFPSSTGSQVQSGPNHGNAAFRVGVVTLAVGIHLIVPSVATGAAGQVSPVIQNGTWVWENTVAVEQSSVTFRLEGTPDGNEVDWRMLISSPDLKGEVYDNFPLYTAATSFDGKTGTWSLNYRIDGATTNVLNADYEEASGAVHELTFSIPESNPNENARGSSVLYQAAGDARLFDWHEPTPGQTHLIEWDAVTRAGSIEAWNYNNGERACWDSGLNDVPCS